MDFQPSEVNKHFTEDGPGTIDTSIRSSSSAEITRTDVVRCIEERALAFQGYESTNTGFLEPLQVVRYGPSEEYKHHFDWALTTRRDTTFFVYLEANCTGGGTNFPVLNPPTDEKWCEFVDCDESYNAGVTFKPIAGNAIFWQNFNADGTGIKESFHAGLPVTTGSKIGLNIWTWRLE